MTAGGGARLADGRAVVLRAAGAGDVGAVARLYLELSPQSFRRRFYTGHVRPELAERFASLDGGTVCLLAVAADDPGSVAGEARYVPIGPAVAELALTVRDGYQRAGLGRLLLAALVARARADGLVRLRAVVLLANVPMLALLQHYGWVLAAPTEDFSVATLEISAVGGMPGWPDGSAGRRVLVERRGWFDDERTAALRAAGGEVRQCAGPRQETGRVCPLVAGGRCRLAEEADTIVSMLPPGEPECAAVLAAHQRRWPRRLAR